MTTITSNTTTVSTTTYRVTLRTTVYDTRTTTTTSTIYATATQPANLTGQYEDADGDFFDLYTYTDFTGHDGIAGACNGGDAYTAGQGLYQCGAFEDCMDICGFYNDQSTRAFNCTGVTYSPTGQDGDSPVCNLKTAIDGCGSPTDYEIDSGIMATDQSDRT